MNRRTVLAGAGLGVSASIVGCLGGAPYTGRRSDEDESAPLTTNKPSVEELERECSASTGESGGGDVRTPDVRIGVNEPDHDVHLDVDIVSEFTENRPAKLAIVIGNDASEPREFEYGPSPLSHGDHETLDAHLHAGYSGLEYDEPDDDGCWRSPNRLGGEPKATRIDLDPGETTSHEYPLVAPADDDQRCLPAGLYRFESTVTVREEDADPSESIGTADLIWGVCVA